MAGCASKDVPVEQSDTAELSGVEIPAYYYAAYADVDEARQLLESEGFKVLGSYASAPKGVTLVVTSDELKKAASKPFRAFASVVRILVDAEHQRIAYTNPVYFGRAYLQQDFDYDTSKRILQKLTRAFGAKTSAPDSLAYEQLADYHFMVGMPYYGDMLQLAEGNTSALLASVEKENEDNATVFRLVLDKDRMLLGVPLSKKAESFVDKLGTQNAELLPYMVLIESGHAVAPDPKYYIALGYPGLTMSEFMGIATVPGTIERELRKLFH